MKHKNNKLRIIPLGGVGEIGKNMTVIEYDKDMIVIDCGFCFPSETMLGVDYVIPNTSYLEANKDKLRAFFITHGHEDHIGATQYILNKFNVPVYGTKLTLALVEAKLEEYRISTKMLRVTEPGDSVKCGSFVVDFIKVSHSIDDAVGFAIHTPAGTIVHTGDFKVDYTPVDGKIIDLHKFAQLGQKGVLALLSDSTNAEIPGFTESEKNVGDSLNSIFRDAKGRLIIATFASNIHRLQQVVNEANRMGRKICIMGRSMVRYAEVAQRLGYLSINQKMFINPEELDKLPDARVTILTTGSQGESMAGLTRMASGEHPRVNIRPGDTVVISSYPISGNERYVSEVINLLCLRGAKVVHGRLAQVHVSGHACQEELKLMLSLVSPKYFIPVHGEARHLYRHAALAEEMGIDKKNIFIPSIGVPIEMNRQGAQFAEPVSSGSVLIDGLGVGDVGNVVLRDRQVLAAEGLFIVIVTIDKNSGELISSPDIVSRGFVYVKESEELIAEARKLIVDLMNKSATRNAHDWLTIKNKIKKLMSTFLYDKTKRSPMILPIIIEV